MNILLTFTYDVALKHWYKSGVIYRELAFYKTLIQRNNDITFLTYGNRSDLKYSKLLGDIKVIPTYEFIKSKKNFIKFLRSLLIIFKLKDIFKNIHLIKTNQVEGCWIAIFAKIFYRKKILIRGGYDWLRNYIDLYKIQRNKNYITYLFRYFKIYMLEYVALKLADQIIYTSDSDIKFIIKTSIQIS